MVQLYVCRQSHLTSGTPQRAIVKWQWQGEADAFPLAIVGDVEVDEESVRNVKIWGDVCRLDEGGVEVNGDGDAAQLLFQHVSGVALLHVEDGGFAGVKDVILVDPQCTFGERDPGHVQTVQLVGGEQGHPRWLLCREGERAEEVGIGAGPVRRGLDNTDGKFVDGHAWDGAADVEP